MKKHLLAALLVASALASHAQNTSTDEHGLIHARPREIALRDSTTGKTFTDAKGDVFKIYKGADGRLFLAVFSARGTYYRRYLQPE